jgi:hypothetical protein
VTEQQVKEIVSAEGESGFRVTVGLEITAVTLADDFKIIVSNNQPPDVSRDEIAGQIRAHRLGQ